MQCPASETALFRTRMRARYCSVVARTGFLDKNLDESVALSELREPWAVGARGRAGPAVFRQEERLDSPVGRSYDEFQDAGE